MGSEWREITLEDALEFVVDNRGKTVPVSDLGVALIATNCVSNNNLYPEHINVRHVAQETYNNWFRSHPQPNDILLTNKGSKNGAVCLVPDPVDFCIAQDMVALRADRSKIDPSYLFAALRSPNIQAQIKQLNVDSVIPHFKKTDFDKLYIPLPAEDEQKQIGSIYLNFSKKIELNRQMNATLEGMAQALFKSWFVDFDPVIDNALAAGNPIPDALAARAEIRGQLLADGRANREAAKPFPAAFHFTEELGWIPEGWGVKQVKGWGEVVCGKTPSKKNADFYGSNVPFIKIPDMHGNVWITDTIDNLSFEGAKSQYKKEIPSNSICVSCIATVGKVTITSARSHTNQQINSIIPDNSASTFYLYFSFLDMGKYLEDLASGGSATLNLNTGNFSRIVILSPPTELLKKFHEAVQSLFSKILTNEHQSSSLASLRDTLLPKLISGELRIPDAEKLVAEAL